MNIKRKTKGSHIIWQKMLVDNRNIKSGNWYMISINDMKRGFFKFKKFERVCAYAFPPFYCELSQRSKIYGINLFFFNLEIHKQS